MTRPKNKAVWDEVTQKYKVVPLKPGETNGLTEYERSRHLKNKSSEWHKKIRQSS